MGSGILNVGVTGLNAAQMGLLTTGHNISNASTPGYSRQEIVQGTNTPVFSGSGYIGAGANVQTVKRNYDQFLASQVLSAQAGASEMESYLSQISQVSGLFADSTAGLSPALADFFKATQTVAANPASIPSRQSMLSGAQALVARFQSLDQRLAEIRDGTNSQIANEVVAINSYAQQLVDINRRIIAAQSVGMNQPANDLLDQRDQLVAELNEEIQVNAVQQSDGTYAVYFGNGQPLVVGTHSMTLVAQQTPDDPSRMAVFITATVGGDAAILQDSLITGGKLGGLIAFRNESLDGAQNALGRIAIGLGQTFNEIHRLGQDLTGALGGNFFSVPQPTVMGSSLNTSASTAVSAQIVDSDYRVTYSTVTGYAIRRLSDGTDLGPFASLPQYVDGVQIKLASGAPANNDVFIVRPGNSPGSRAIAQSDNAGTAVLDSSGSNIQALEGSDYRLVYTATNTFTLTRLSDSEVWTGTGATPQGALDALATQHQTGFNLTLGGTAPSVGDSFVVLPTRYGARNLGLAISDPKTIAAAAPFRTAAGSANTGTASISAGSVDDKSYLPLAGTVTLTYDSTAKTFTVTGANPAAQGPIDYDPATASPMTISFNGLSFTISGTPADADTFSLSPNTNGVSDNRIAQLLGNLQTQNTLLGSPGSFTTGATATFAQAYAQIVSSVGAVANRVTVTGQAQQSLANQAQAAKDSISGVNLDEEASNLLRYQQAYQASAKIIEIAGRLFDQVLALGN